MPSWILLCSGSNNSNCLCHRYIQLLLRRRRHFFLYCLSLWDYMSEYWNCVSYSCWLSRGVYMLGWSSNSMFSRNVLSIWNSCDDTLCWRYLLRYLSPDFMQSLYCWQSLSPLIFYTWMCGAGNMSYRLFLLRGNWLTYRITMPTGNLRRSSRIKHTTSVY
jgi:hypothetical protein